MITTVTGYFKKYDIEVETETEDFNTVKKIDLHLILIQLIQIMNREIHI